MTIEILLYCAAYLYDGPYAGRNSHQKACFLIHQVQEDYQATDTAPHNCGGNEPSARETSRSVGYHVYYATELKGQREPRCAPTSASQRMRWIHWSYILRMCPELCAVMAHFFFCQCLCDRKLRCGEVGSICMTERATYFKVTEHEASVFQR